MRTKGACDIWKVGKPVRCFETVLTRKNEKICSLRSSFISQVFVVSLVSSGAHLHTLPRTIQENRNGHTAENKDNQAEQRQKNI